MLAESYYYRKSGCLPRKRIKGKMIRCNTNTVRQPDPRLTNKNHYSHTSNKQLGNVMQKNYTYDHNKNFKKPTNKLNKKCPKTMGKQWKIFYLRTQR